MNLQYMAPTILRAAARRLIVPSIVLVAVGAMVVYATVDIEAENRRKLSEIGSMVWQIDEIDVRIANLARDLNVIRTQGRRYTEIRDSGFIGEQNRLRAAQLLEELGPKYGLSYLRYDFMPQSSEVVEGAERTTFHLVHTDIALDVASLTDTQLLGFVAEFTDRLNGQVQVRLLKIRRGAEISTDLLDQIASGDRPSLFEAKIQLTWNNVTVIVDGGGDEDDNGTHDDEDRGGDLDES
jgi:hypothetical protein